MAFIGLDSWMIARIDPKTHTVITDTSKGGLKGNTPYAGVFNVNLTDAGGATQANISNLQGSVTKTYGSNAVARAAAGTPEPTVALGANGLPFDILNAITGMVPDGNGGWVRTTDPGVNHCALLICSSDWDNNKRYVGFYDGTVTMGNTNIQTNTNSEKITADSLTFTALGINSEVGQSGTAGTTITTTDKTVATGNSIKVYHMFSTEAANFNYDAMIKEIFPQAVAASNVQAATSSSSH